LEALWRRIFGRVIALGVLAAAAVLGVLAARAEAQTVFLAALGLIVAAPIGFLALQFITEHREWAPMLILLACLSLPLGVPVRGSYFVLSLILTAGFAALWVLRMLTVERRFSLAPASVNLPILGFALTVLISFGWSNLFRDVIVITWSSFPFVQGSSALVMIMLPVLSLMLNTYFHDVKWLRYCVGLLLAAAVFGLISEFVVTVVPVETRGTFAMWVISVIVSLLLFHRGLGLWAKAGLVALMLGWGYWSFGLRITWLASWLPTLVALLVLCFMRSWRLLLALALAGVVWAAANQAYIGSTFEAENEESGHTRLAAWAQNWEITREHLLFGTGPAGYAAYYMTYFPDNAMATHSNYIDIVSQLGVVGLAFYVWIFGAFAWTGLRLCLRLRGRGDFAEMLANAAFAGTLGCIVINAFGDWLIPFAYTQGISGFDYAAYNWLFMAVIPVLDRLTQPQAQALVPQP
jgi:O-antigen ligase